jgi:DNA-binding transcriptional ArsR family regulator
MEILPPAPKIKELKIDQLRLQQASGVLRAVNHPLRQKLLRLLHQQGEICVTDLYHTMDLEQSVASQHLSVLRNARVVATRREGKQVYYSVDHTRLDEIMHFVRSLLN